MPISLELDVAQRTVHIRVWGRVSRPDVLEALHAMLEDVRFEPGFAQLCDLREVGELEITGADLRSIADVALGVADRLGAGRLALVSDRPAVFGMSRMYEVFSEELPVSVRAFRDYEEAVRWLGGR